MRERAGLIVAVAALLAGAPTAHAQDIARVPLGSSIRQLIAGPDGGAWVRIEGLRLNVNSIGRATPDGRFSVTAVRGFVGEGAVGPDGQAWFRTGKRELLRSDAAGALTRVRVPDVLNGPLATGPDGTLWGQASDRERIARVTPAGTATFRPFPIEGCSTGIGNLQGLARASDGAMWAADDHCERVFRITDAGIAEIPATGLEAEELAADNGGGVWFAGLGLDVVGHATAAGVVTRYDIGHDDGALDVAVAADQTAWVATGRCTLLRITPGSRAIARVASPVPARQLAFDPAGALLLASPARLVRHAPGSPAAGCDDRPPVLRLSPGRNHGTVSLQALRRARGLRMTVREPASVVGFGILEGPRGPIVDERITTKIVRDSRGRTVRHPFPAALLRRVAREVAAGKRWRLEAFATAVDAEGNGELQTFSARVTR